MNWNLNKLLIILGVLLIFTACDVYNIGDIIKKGKQFKTDNNNKLDSLITISNNLAIDTCNIYSILISPVTDFFAFKEFKYSVENKSLLISKYCNISDLDKKKIYSYFPIDEMEELYFVKNSYVSFDLSHCRDKNWNNVSVIYCYNKEKFKNTFSDYIYFEIGQEKEINDQKKWVYFYNDHWAITNCRHYSRNEHK